MLVQNFTANPDLRIGKIIEISGNALRIELDIKLTELTRSVNGKVYSIGQIGSIIKIHFGRKILFAYVSLLRMRSDLLAEEGITNMNPGDDTRILEADLFGQGIWRKNDNLLEFSRGVETYPLPLQDAFLCLNDELEFIYKSAEGIDKDSAYDPMVPIGHYIGSNNAICKANIDKMFGHHCAILGSTGSGKSGAVASILHSVINHSSNTKAVQPKIVIIDPHGEYASAFGKSAVVYKAYDESSVTTDKSVALKLPYWLMSCDELKSLIIGKTEFEATSQSNIVYQAIAYARLTQCGLVHNIGTDPKGEDKDNLPRGGTKIEDILNFDRDKPLPFALSEVIKHIDKIQGQKPNTITPLAQSSGRDKIDGILKKLKMLISNPQLGFMMNEFRDDSPSLDEVLSQFIGDRDGQNIRIIDISGLPNEVAGPLTALISRLLFQYKLWQTREERQQDPVLFVCEEAHRYVPNHGDAQYKEAQQAIRRIAKEGRKYGLGLMLVSQRPSDVESTVLSQCNSWLILRLTNTSDQEHVSKFLPDSLIGLTKMLPSLTRSEAIFVGEAAALPSRIRINKLPKDKLPDSHDISFVKGWTGDLIDTKSLKGITDRWAGTFLNKEHDLPF